MKAPFRRLAARAAVLAFAWTAEAAAQPARPPCDQGELRAHLAATPPPASIAGGRVSLMPPPGLTALPPDGVYDLVLAGPGGTVVIAWFSAWAPEPGSPGAAELLSRYIELRSPDIEWLRRDTVEISGTRWLRFHYTRRMAGEYELYEQHYATAFQGRGVHVRMTTDARDEQRRAQLMASGETLQYMASLGNKGFVVAFRTRADAPDARARLAESAATLEMENCVLPERTAGGN